MLCRIHNPYTWRKIFQSLNIVLPTDGDKQQRHIIVRLSSADDPLRNRNVVDKVSSSRTGHHFLCRQTGNEILLPTSWKQVRDRQPCRFMKKLILWAKPSWTGRTQRTSTVDTRRYVGFVGRRRGRQWHDGRTCRRQWRLQRVESLRFFSSWSPLAHIVWVLWFYRVGPTRISVRPSTFRQPISYLSLLAPPL